jgi:hypothetical protein
MSDSPSERGFIRVDCATCDNPDVWFTCNQCGKSDHFTLHADHVSCDCSARYDRGTCTCGAVVPFERLRFVDADAGPLALADLEIAWDRVALLAIGLVVVLGGLGYALLT